MVLLDTAPPTIVPPGRRCRSTTATRLPQYAACAAAVSPAGPAPSTTRSQWADSMPRTRYRLQDGGSVHLAEGVGDELEPGAVRVPGVDGAAALHWVGDAR